MVVCWTSFSIRERRNGDAARNKTSCVLAPRSSGKENHHRCETFRWDPAGKQSRPAKPGQQPEASLAWWRATSTAKRRQRVPMPCDRAPKSLLAGATVVDTSGGRAEAPQWLGASRSCRGPRTGRRDMRVAREPERPCRFRRHCRPETRLTNSRLIRGPRPRPTGTNEGRNDGIAKRRKRSAAKRAARSRSVS